MMATSAKKLHEVLFSDLDHELQTTRRMLERYPSGHGDWKPHEKSMPFGSLAAHVADIPSYGTMILNTDGLDFGANPPSPSKPRETAAELVAAFDKHVAALQASLTTMDAERADSSWTLRQGEKVFFSQPKSDLVRHMTINHLIHHRAQLGVYYRMLGVPVPGSYGPSADEPM